MKDKIVVFIVGFLVGAIISTGAFYIYTTTSKCDYSNQNTLMNGGEPPEMPSGQNTPPEKPNGQPPEKPSDDNLQNSNMQDND